MLCFVLEGDGSVSISNVMPVLPAGIAYCILVISQKYFLLEYTYMPKIEVYLCACFVPTTAVITAL